ncbi:hypothetical protein NDU88_001831 [Pleurodeles waltl]|uniref:Uncharacterized protein n=1 Tax=Pleurodeles waltl TaxID=8319 RepID=A0AAV7T0Q7_PLEWA|nr:hypothetical protein NDU88_001831 [Pleurodeles waltl]
MVLRLHHSWALNIWGQPASSVSTTATLPTVGTFARHAKVVCVPLAPVVSAMPSGKFTPQLLFTEIVTQSRPASTPATSDPPPQDPTMDHILQEITVVGHRLEGSDTKMSDLRAELRSIRKTLPALVIVGRGGRDDTPPFDNGGEAQSHPGPELWNLHIKLSELEDRSQRVNLTFLGFVERAEGSDTRGFLRDLLPTLAGLTFSFL